MALNAKNIPAQGGNSNTPILEAGNYPARVVQVLDLGLQAQRPFQGKEKPPANEIMITYELGTEFMLDDDGNELKDKPRWISEILPLYNMKADMAKSTKRMNSLDPAGALDGDFSQIVGLPCTLTAVHNASRTDKTKIYVNIGGVTPPMKGFPVPELVNPPRVFDIDAPDMETFNSLPDWIQDKMKANLNFQGSALQAALGGAAAPSQAPAPAAEEDEGEDNPY